MLTLGKSCKHFGFSPDSKIRKQSVSGLFLPLSLCSVLIPVALPTEIRTLPLVVEHGSVEAALEACRTRQLVSDRDRKHVNTYLPCPSQPSWDSCPFRPFPCRLP
jgi:hypothetical protein